MTTAPAVHPDRHGRAEGAGGPRPRGGTMWIYPDRLRQNAEALRHAYGPWTIAVIKGDGYGLGVATCATALASAGVRAMAVGSILEASQVRAAGVNARLMVLDSAGIDVSELNVEWLVGQIEISRLLAHRSARPLARIHIEIDFGVGRGGVPADQTDETLSALLGHPMIRVVGLAGHLPANPSEATVHEALTMLGRLRRRCPGAIAHLGGSDVLRWHRPTPAACVRIGRPLYGIMPRTLRDGDGDGDGDGVIPAWAWLAGATAYQSAPSIGYQGASPPEGAPVRLDVGYADGLPPQAAQHWPVLIDGHPYVIHQVFMLSSIAYPTGHELPPGTSATALLSGRCDRYSLPTRQISESLGIATTAILMYPRSSREVATK